jgi:Tfp pilus assembly protein PilN
MGQQQLLLIILGVIIVGIAVAVGITMFQDNAVDQNRSAVIADLTTLAAKASNTMPSRRHLVAAVTRS